MPTYQVTTDKGTYQVDTQEGVSQEQSQQSNAQSQTQPQTQSQSSDQTSSDFSNASSALDNISNPQQSPAQPQGTTNNVATNFTGDIVRGFLNSAAGTIDKVNGVAKMLNNVTSANMGTGELDNVSNKLKQMAQSQPTSGNNIVSGAGQLIGSIPDAIAEFAGTGGGVGFIARAAALSAAQEYNKSQNLTSTAEAGATGAAVGAVIDKIPGALAGTANIIKKWGMTGGKSYLQAVTGATDKEAADIIEKLQNDPNFNINPKIKVEDYNEAKESTKTQLDTLKENNSNIVKQQTEQNSRDYMAAKTASDDAVNSLVENNRDVIEDLRAYHVQSKEDLANTTSSNMISATDANVQKLADVTQQTTLNTAKARQSLDNTLVNVFGTANKNVETYIKGASDDVANAHASLEKNGLDYVPTPIVAKELDSAIGTGFNKYYTKLSREAGVPTEESFLNKEVSSGVRVRDLPPEAQAQYKQQAIRQGQPNIAGIARSGNTMDSLTAAPGIKNGSVLNAIKLINDTKKGLVEEFSKFGKTSLIAMDSQADAIENAINKGFFGKGVPEQLAATLAKIKQAINPTKLFEKYPSELSHLKPLAEANTKYSSKIDNLRNALNLYKDNVDGTVNPQKVFSALDRNDSGYIAKLKQADESLPKEDRIFDKVKNAYDNYRTIESSEKTALSNTEKEISSSRLSLNKKFDDMKKQLSVEQRKELVDTIKSTREAKRTFSQQEGTKLKDLHSKQQNALEVMRSQKDKELQTLQGAINKRLNDLHLLHMARGGRAAATGNARIFQNVANYRSIDGLTTLNPAKMAQGSVISKFASPIGAANNVKWALNAPSNFVGLQQAAGNKILKRLVTTKLSGR